MSGRNERTMGGEPSASDQPGWRVIAGMITRAVSWAALVLVSALAIVILVVPLVGGARTFTVLTGSMVPNYPPGTLVVVRPVDPHDIAIGDVITYQLESGKPAVVTHRVVGIGADVEGRPLFTLRGDANTTNDAKPVQVEQMVGRLWYSVPYIGWVNNVVTGELRAYVIPAVVVGLFGYALIEFIKAARSKRTRARAESAEGEAPERD